MEKQYEEILELPHHVSKSRRQMCYMDRAAQFAPFAALTGYDDSIKSAEIKSCERISLSECDEAEIDKKLRLILENLDKEPLVSAVFFEEKENYDVGKYVTITDNVKEIDLYNNRIIFKKGAVFSINNIYSLSLISFD